MDSELQLRVHLAVLFGCPLWKVGEIVPASELAIWRVHFANEPWGFKAQDMLASKTAKQIFESTGRLRAGTSYRDFMFTDAFESLDLTHEQFALLSDAEQHDYVKRQIEAAKRVLN